MSSKGFVVVLTEEGLKLRNDIKTYSSKWGVNQTEQSTIISNFLNELSHEMQKVINQQKALYQGISPEEFRNIYNQVSFGKDVVTLEDIQNEILKLENLQKIESEQQKSNRKKFSQQLESARKTELAAQKGIAALLANGRITEGQIPGLISQLRTLSKQLDFTEATINQIIENYILNQPDIKDNTLHETYKNLYRLADTYKQAPGFKIVNGKIEANNLFSDTDMVQQLEKVIKLIKKQEKITQSSSKTKKREAMDNVRRNYIRRGKELENNIFYSNKANFELQKLINSLTKIAKSANASKTEEEVRQIVRTNIINLIDDYISSPSIHQVQGLYTFQTIKDQGIHGNISEEIQATVKPELKDLQGEIIKLSAKVLGDTRTRNILKTVGKVTAEYKKDVIIPFEDFDLDQTSFEYFKVINAEEQDKGDVVYQLKNVLNKQKGTRDTIYISFSDKFRHLQALTDQAIIGSDDKKTSSVLNSMDLFNNSTNAHAILFALLNWHSVSYLSSNFQGIQENIKQAINTQILDFAFNRKNLFNNIKEAFQAEASIIDDSNTLHVFRIGANGFIPVYQILEGILIKMHKLKDISEIVSSTISQSGIGTSEELYNQALSLHPDATQARWNYVAQQVAAAIDIRVAIHFDQLLQLFTLN